MEHSEQDTSEALGVLVPGRLLEHSEQDISEVLGVLVPGRLSDLLAPELLSEPSDLPSEPPTSTETSGQPSLPEQQLLMVVSPQELMASLGTAWGYTVQAVRPYPRRTPRWRPLSQHTPLACLHPLATLWLQLRTHPSTKHPLIVKSYGLCKAKLY